jgi:hypothetical protein
LVVDKAEQMVAMEIVHLALQAVLVAVQEELLMGGQFQQQLQLLEQEELLLLDKADQQFMEHLLQVVEVLQHMVQVEHLVVLVVLLIMVQQEAILVQQEHFL